MRTQQFADAFPHPFARWLCKHMRGLARRVMHAIFIELVMISSAIETFATSESHSGRLQV
jgi:hypothetical protein